MLPESLLQRIYVWVQVSECYKAMFKKEKNLCIVNKMPVPFSDEETIINLLLLSVATNTSKQLKYTTFPKIHKHNPPLF